MANFRPIWQHWLRVFCFLLELDNFFYKRNGREFKSRHSPELSFGALRVIGEFTFLFELCNLDRFVTSPSASQNWIKSMKLFWAAIFNLFIVSPQLTARLLPAAGDPGSNPVICKINMYSMKKDKLKEKEVGNSPFPN